MKVLPGILVAAAVALGLGWLVNQPGHATISWFGRTIAFHPVVGVAVALGLLLLFLLLARLWGGLRYRSDLFGPGRTLRQQAAARGPTATALVAYLAGEREGAAKLAAKALRQHPNEWTALAVAAFAGDADAEAALRRDKDLGGLAVMSEFLRLRSPAAAEALARLRPSSPVAQAALLRSRALAGDWTGAREALYAWIAADPQLASSSTWREASLDHAAGSEAVAGGEGAAAEQFFHAALAAEPRFSPAAVALAGLLARQQRLDEAERVLELAWAAAPEPAIARSYLGLHPVESAGERLVRVERLVSGAPGAAESRLTLAEQALLAGDSARALDVVSPLLGEKPVRARAALVGVGAYRELGGVPPHQSWPDAVIGGAREPDWACVDCRGHSPEWALFCPSCEHTGALVPEPCLPVGRVPAQA
jgi:HemY protein